MSTALAIASLRNEYNRDIAPFFSSIVKLLNIQSDTNPGFEVLSFEDAQSIWQVWDGHTSSAEWEDDLDETDVFDGIVPNSPLMTGQQDFLYVRFYKSPNYILKTTQEFVRNHLGALLELDGDCISIFAKDCLLSVDMEVLVNKVMYSIKNDRLN